MDEKWIEGELGKLANSSVNIPADLDNKTRLRIREEVPLKKGRSVSMSKLKAMGILPASVLVVVLIFLTTMAFLSLSGPAGGGELALGKYETEDGLVWVELIEGKQFVFNRHVATSYRPEGQYMIQDDELVLHVSDEEEYRFSIIGDTIVFKRGEMAEALIKAGTVLTYTGEPSYIALDQLPDPYPVELAKENGDVVYGHNIGYNIMKLDRFLDDAKESGTDWVRITQYTKEGDAIISDLIRENDELRLLMDTTRDNFGVRAVKEYAVNEIVKDVRNGLDCYIVKLTNSGEIVLACVDIGDR